MSNLLVLAASRGYSFSIGTLIVNITRVSPGTFSEVVILSEDLSRADLEIISRLIKVKVVDFEAPVSKRAMRRSPYLRFFTPFVLAKLEAFKYAEFFDTVTWLDNDVAVLRALDELVKVGLRRNAFVPTRGDLRSQLVKDLPGFASCGPAPAGGTFVVSGKCGSTRHLYQTLMRVAEDYSSYFFLPDQATMGIAFQKLGISWDILDEKLYAPHPSDAPVDAFIHHPYGPKKFWSGLQSDYWDHHYREWLSLGGSKVSPKARWREISRILTKFEIRIRLLFSREFSIVGR